MSIFDRLKDKATGMMGGDKSEGKGKGEGEDMVEQGKEKAQEMGDRAKETMDKHRPDS